MKKKVTKAIELYRMSGTQRVQWAKAVKMQHDIDEMAVIRDNLLRSSTDKAFRDSIKQSFADKIYKAQHELNAYMDGIEATRQKQACSLIATQAICDLACTLSDRFGDECKRVTHNSTQKNAYVELGKDAVNETYRATKLVTDKVMDRWNDVVTAIDSVQDDTVSNTFAHLSEQFQARMLQLVEEFEKEIKNSYTAYF